MARVTVINNSDEFLAVMSDVIAEAGHQCTALKGAEHTIDDIADSRPDVVVVDLRLEPGILTDGWAVILGARAHPQLEDIPIVLCTADLQFLQDRAAEIAALADVHPLAKPFDIDDVDALLEQLLSR